MSEQDTEHTDDAKFGYLIMKHSGFIEDGARPLSVRAIERGTREAVGLGDEDDVRIAVFRSRNEAAAEMKRLCRGDNPDLHGLSVRPTYEANLWGTVWDLVGQNGFVVPSNPWQLWTCRAGDARSKEQPTLGEVTSRTIQAAFDIVDQIRRDRGKPRQQGINPEMDQSAASEGLHHWSCVSRQSNRWWVRVDGAEFTSGLTGVERGGTIMDGLRWFDANWPMKSDTNP